jgi:hypothetical protein
VDLVVGDVEEAEDVAEEELVEGGAVEDGLHGALGVDEEGIEV